MPSLTVIKQYPPAIASLLLLFYHFYPVFGVVPARPAVGGTEGVISGLGALLSAGAEDAPKTAAAALGFLAFSAPVAARMASTEGLLASLVRALGETGNPALQ
eukprot:1191462-Prorocentrum_minimum.AAC.2